MPSQLAVVPAGEKERGPVGSNEPIEKEKQRLNVLVDSSRHIVNFGSRDDAVSEEWLARAEQALNQPLPESYKWFLRNYAGGDIDGEEIFSIYGMDFEAVNGGDIVIQHRAAPRAGLLGDSKVVISKTDLGEVFSFDCSRYACNEYPIRLRLPSGENMDYASDFHEFLTERIDAHS